jgi:dTDP-glucose 4,6-dehydratase
VSSNLLITGGAGFIGSHFVLEHSAKYPEDKIIVLDKLTYAGDRKFLDPVRDAIVFVEGDIADIALVERLVQEHGVDTIVNFAAETHVDRSIDDPFPFLHTNVLGVQSLLAVCRKHLSLKLLHISTDEVYGDLQDIDPPKKTDDPLLPSSPYAASKASGDLLVLAAVRTWGVKAAISRCTNNFGPHQASEKFIPTVIRSALADKPVPIYAEGKNKRDWLYVTDHCSAIETILARDESFGGRIFNVSADSEKCNIDVAKTILRILKKPESLLTSVKDRPGHDWRYALDSSGTRKLGWKPAVGFEEGLRRTVEWYKERMR